MSVFVRLGRTLQGRRRVRVGAKAAYGAGGEEMTRSVLDGHGYHVVYNPIVPHPKESGRFLETDAIVYGQGSLFCVETKRYKGSLSWSASGGGKRELVKHKAGKYGEGTFERSYPDPLAKTKFFISSLKRHLSKTDARLGRLYFHPVVAFAGGEHDISGVRSFDDGYVDLAELTEFIRSRRNERFAARPSRFILDGLSTLPSWDRVVTRDGDTHYGVLRGSGVDLRGSSGSKTGLSYGALEELSVIPGGMFSAYDEVEASTGDGRSLSLKSSFARIRLNDLDRDVTHRLRDVSRLIVGTVPLRRKGDGRLI